MLEMQRELIASFEDELPKAGAANTVTLYIEFLNHIMDSLLHRERWRPESIWFRLYMKCLKYMRETECECFASLWEYFAANERLGQFFTPDGVCDAMARITLLDIDWDRYSIDRPLVIGEPTAGGGKTLLGVLKQIPDGYLHKVLFHATELDRNVAVCCALNMLHFNANAYVVQGDAISQKPVIVYRTIHDAWAGGELTTIEDEASMGRIMSMALAKNINLNQGEER